VNSKNDFAWATTSKAFRSVLEEGEARFVRIIQDVCLECGRTHDTLKTCVHKRPRRIRYRAHAELGGLLDINILQEIVENNGYENLTDMCRHMIQLAKEGRSELVVIDTSVGDHIVRKTVRQQQESKLGAMRESLTHKS
jgi:Ni2+-binding GTPase involved in maturation of urease and hydrogenase